MTHFEATLGAPIRVTYSLTRDGVAEDPATLRLIVRRFGGDAMTIPDWTGADDQIIKDSTGNFHAEVVPPVVGQHVYRWEAFDADGESIGASEGEFIVHSLLR